MNRLLDIGFESAGHWILKDDELVLELFRHASQRNILYAFVSDGQVKYVGKTVQPLSNRMAGYRKPGSSQTTNIKNHDRIKTLLRSGAAVEILALPDNGLLHYGQFHLNLAAGLEDNIIRMVDPEWNRGERSQESEQSTAEPSTELKPVRSFTVTLRPTYLNMGFFNIGATNADSLGADGQEIEIFCGDAEQPVRGVINRRANTNGTPRIMGGTGLRDWFRENISINQKIAIAVLSPTAIRVKGEG